MDIDLDQLPLSTSHVRPKVNRGATYKSMIFNDHRNYSFSSWSFASPGARTVYDPTRAVAFFRF